MAEFKPCPFCGGEPTVEITNRSARTVRVYCQNIKCPITTVGLCIEETDVGEAMKYWNTRAEEPAEEKTAHWDINCDGYYPFCSRCGEATQHMSPYCPNCGRKMITRGHEDT